VRAPRGSVIARVEHMLGLWSVVGLGLFLLLTSLMLLLVFDS
jgi:hypothetical protein